MRTIRPSNQTSRAGAMMLLVCLGYALHAGCASTAAPPARSVAAVAPAADCDPARDRAAIRKMAGEYDVSFEFDETEVLAEGYTRREPYSTVADEVIEILEDSERAVVMQHLLLVKEAGKLTVIKHWRQDWKFEDRELVEYRGDHTWERRPLGTADAACTWSQAVYEVTDAPRYESIGRWRHEAGSSTWVSQETWRPLPRREYTTRKDYDLLRGVNRLVVRDSGWAHEQDNVKIVLAGDRRLVRERGLNRYERTALPEATLAREYLQRTSPFWSAVRDEWRELLAARPRLALRTEVEGKPLQDHLFPLADRSPGVPAAELRRQSREAIARYVRAQPAVATGSASSTSSP